MQDLLRCIRLASSPRATMRPWTDAAAHTATSACCSIPVIVLRVLRTAFVGIYGVIVLLFLGCGLALVWLAGRVLWHGVIDVGIAQSARFDAILRTIGHLTIGVAALELGQTVLEEEVLRSTHVSGPTRARRFLARVRVVVVVALAVESLIAIFHAASDSPEYLPHAASIAGGAAVLLAAWGVFVHLNRGAEEMEPESMAAAKQEDVEVQQRETGGA